MQDILFVSGTRPEIIKLAPLYHRLRGQPGLRPIWLHTGQHDGMAHSMHACFDIVPDITFERDGTSLCEFSCKCRMRLETVMAGRHSAMVIVQGDTESAFLGALAGFYQHLPVAHVEAGLRTHNLAGPFPEEGLRQMIARISTYHFPPTARARQMLLDEGIEDDRILVTGNTVVDAQRWAISRHHIARKVRGRGHLLVTTHRRENWGHDLAQTCYAIAAIANRHPELDVLFPVHLNPVVQRPAHAILDRVPNVRLTAPLDYLEMQQALADSWLVLTDSGGLQEEAPTFRVPLLVLRNETERPEAIDAGCARLTGNDFTEIVESVEQLWSDEIAYHRMQQVENPFGDGHACERIAARIGQAMSDRTLRAVGVA